jgi:thiamine kinase-like enzyme
MSETKVMSTDTQFRPGRLVGEGRTDAELKAEQAIAAVSQWRDARVRYQPIAGGLSNSNWRIDVESDPTVYFLKVPGEGSSEYVDRENAHAAARRASESGIGPRVVSLDARTGVEIIEFLQTHRACTNADLKSLEIAKQIIELYRKFNSAAPLPHTKTIFDSVDGYLEQIGQLSVVLPGYADKVLLEYQQAKAAFNASGLDIVPCHSDPMPGNFLISDGAPMRMIDYEFAGNNERAYELAVMVTEYFYDEAKLLECVEAYYGNTDWATVARVQVACAVADVNWGLWACVKRRYDPDSSFDYFKYGVWKLFRARSKMSDPRWGAWLRAL